MADGVEQLVRHMAWADARVHDAATDERARDDANVRELLHHVHGVQRAYLQLWRGDELAVPDPAEFDDLEAVARWGREGHAAILELVTGLDERERTRPLEVPWAAKLVERYGEARTTTLEETVVQVASHSTYHRGQINRRLRELGVEPPLTDFIAWIWEGRPER